MHLSLEASVKLRDCGQKPSNRIATESALFGGGRMA
jgi:hypothetical protein